MDEKPKCFISNPFVYPVCKGNGNEMCKKCSLYENLEDEGEEK